VEYDHEYDLIHDHMNMRYLQGPHNQFSKSLRKPARIFEASGLDGTDFRGPGPTRADFREGHVRHNRIEATQSFHNPVISEPALMKKNEHLSIDDFLSPFGPSTTGSSARGF
jgi:hypothetical protein